MTAITSASHGSLISPFTTSVLGLSLFAFEAGLPSKSALPQEARQGDLNAETIPAEQEESSRVLVQRSDLIKRMSTIARNEEKRPELESAESRIDVLRPLVAEYRTLMKNEPSPNLEELGRARALVFSPFNVTFFSNNVEPEQSRSFLKECVFDFYGDIAHRLKAHAKVHPEGAVAAEEMLGSILSDTIWSAAHEDEVSLGDAVGLLEQEFLSDTQSSPLTIYLLIASHGDASASDPHAIMASIFAMRRFQEIKSSFTGILQERSTAGLGSLTQNDIIQLFDLPEQLQHHLSIALQHNPSQKELITPFLERVQTELREPLSTEIVNLWASYYRLSTESPPARGFIGPLGFFVRISHETDTPKEIPEPDQITQAICEHLHNWKGCKVGLGNRIADGIQAQYSDSQRSPIPVVQQIHALSHLAPHPSKREGIIAALREGLLASTPDLEMSYPPKQLGSIMAEALLPDYSFCSTSQCEGFDARAGGIFIRELGNGVEDLSLYQDVLTPSQMFIIELLRIQQGGAAAHSVEWYRHSSSGDRTRIRQRTNEFLTSLAATLYEMAPIDLRSPKQSDFTFVALPERLAGATIHAPDPDRMPEFRSSIGWLCDIGDCIVEATARSESISEKAEIDLLIGITDLLDSRREIVSPGGLATCDAVLAARKRYRTLIGPSSNGPFFRCRDSILNQLHPNRIDGTTDWTRMRRGSDEALAFEYAQKAESHFVVHFALTLIGDIEKPEDRPLESLKGTKEHLVIPRVRGVLVQYDLFLRDERVRDAFEGPARAVVAELTLYRDELEKELIGLSQKIKERTNTK